MENSVHNKCHHLLRRRSQHDPVNADRVNDRMDRLRHTLGNDDQDYQRHFYRVILQHGSDLSLGLCQLWRDDA